MNIVLLGIQGSGKGTLVENLKKHFDFTLISVGSLLRREVETGSSIGKRINKTLSSGALVDTSIIMDVLNKNLIARKDMVVFDGFPRSLEQAKALDKLLKVDLLLYLDLDKQTAIERILNRKTCSKCEKITTEQQVKSNVCPHCGGELFKRSDDTLETVQNRFKIYEEETLPLLNKYKISGVTVASIDANKTPEEVLKKALEVINEYNN